MKSCNAVIDHPSHRVGFLSFSRNSIHMIHSLLNLKDGHQKMLVINFLYDRSNGMCLSLYKITAKIHKIFKSETK